MDRLELDRLLLVVANDPWQKSGQRAVSPAEDRYALSEALAEEIPGAVDTAEEVLAPSGDRPVELFLVVGADLVPELGTWHRAEDLRGLVTLVVVSRPTGEEPAVPPGWRAVRVDGPRVAVSSSEVRDLLAAGEPVDSLVPPAVIRCIRRRGMYAVGR
jgi:nicotinate-nucleotide adenylyltransferase